MDSDERNFSDEEGSIFEVGLKPYKLEPMYTENELEIMSRREDDATTESSGSYTDMSWCKCSHCIQNINIAEKICCKNPQMLFEEEFDCITKTTSFANVCLDKNVLKAAMGAWREFRDETRSPENKNYRFISYKQYIWWSYGYLGKNKRKPLPNCVITKIRDIYPEQSGNYVQYKE